MNKIINLKELNFDKSQNYSNKNPNDHVIYSTTFNYYLTQTSINYIIKIVRKQTIPVFQSFVQTYVPYKVISIILSNSLVTLNMNLILLLLQKPGTQ